LAKLLGFIFIKAIVKIQGNTLKHTDRYYSEVNLQLPAWLKSLSQVLKQGLVLLIDYGYPEHEYYHPDRHMGTLMCHYRHHSHSDPFFLPGLQDISTHVNFTALAESAQAVSLDVVGYTTQAAFLLACGLIEFAQQNINDEKAMLANNQAIKLLTLPSEMGELFKVMALSKHLDIPLMGFSLLDLRTRL